MFKTPAWRTAFVIVTFFISISTVLLKQHSIIDIFAGLALSFIVYPFVFLKKKNTPDSAEDNPAVNLEKNTEKNEDSTEIQITYESKPIKKSPPEAEINL